jgi:hypothetical protein
MPVRAALAVTRGHSFPMSVEDRKREEMELLLSSPKDNGGEAVQS